MYAVASLIFLELVSRLVQYTTETKMCLIQGTNDLVNVIKLASVLFIAVCPFTCQ